MNATRFLAIWCSAAAFLFCLSIVPIGAQGLDELEVDLPRPLGAKALSRPLLSNEVQKVELSLDSGYRALLPKQTSPLVYGAIPLAGVDEISDFDRDKVTTAKLLLSGRHEEAEILLRKLRRQRVGDTDLHCLQATVCFYQKRTAEADQLLKQLLENEPLHPTALFLQLCLQHVQEDSPKPVFDWSRSALMQSEMFVTWLDLSRVHLLRVLSAEQFASVCRIAIGDGSEDRLGPIADSLSKARRAYQKNDFANALIFYDLARSHGLRSQALFLKTAECLFRLDRLPEALTRLNGLTTRFPDNPHFWYNKGLVHMQMANYKLAEPAFEKASDLIPRNGLFRFAAACSYAAQGRVDDAMPLVERIAENYPDQIDIWLEGEESYLKAIRKHPRYLKVKTSTTPKKP